MRMTEDSKGDVALAITRLAQALAPFPDLELVILFGSIASGRARDDSDIDVAVQAVRPLTAEQRMTLLEAIALAFDRPVDVIDLATVGEPLLNQIVTTGLRVRGSNAAWGRLIYRNIMENTDFVPLQERILTGRQRAWIGK